MQCPNCGRPIAFDEKYAKVVSCPYCNSILEFGGGELTKVGEQGIFIEFPSQFSVGKQTEFKGKNIYIKGQLRYEYDGGFLDEYFTEVDGKVFFIREDDGIITVYSELEAKKVNIDISLDLVGNNLEYDGQKFYVEEVGIIKLTNIKGFVNTKIVPGREYQYLIGVSNGKRYNFEKDLKTGEFRVFKEENL
ncbi:hypothetical protein BKN14_02260 [Candidatus Gracilibacteria bacterium HOT-871]|nr:hypothetical protein BKN14_02260 [Candidatus Gracilibacteria bacterium HOT-871]RKW20378.1 MAG: DUF4178 domain-containing protein [Candidatus Gracilibacteria bacterium]